MPSAAAINAHVKEREEWEARLKIAVGCAATINPEPISHGALADAFIVSAIRVALAGAQWKAATETEKARMESRLRSAILVAMRDHGPAELTEALDRSRIDNN